MQHPPHVQTKREIEQTLADAGLRPRKRFGQHFLIDGNLMRRLVDRAELNPDDVVLEVGPGTGGLTDLLVNRVSHVISVEVDRDLFRFLVRRFRDATNVTLLSGDVLLGKHQLMPEVVDALHTHTPGAGGSSKLAANLPYQVATPLVMNILVDFPQVRRLCFTVQAEVAERISAAAGCKAYGPLSIIAQSLCSIETVAHVGGQAFWPRPAVDSAMLCLIVRESPFASLDELRRFSRFIRGVFEHRRKTLRSALAYVLNEPDRQRIVEQVDATRRPEQIGVLEWIRVFAFLPLVQEHNGAT